MENEDYLLLKEKPALDDVAWVCVLGPTSQPDEIQRAFNQLKKFEGCWIRADAIICRLIEAKMPPAFTLIAWEDSWHWSGLGLCFHFFVPKTKPMPP
ncbi:MAG: hypothetical protein HY220_02615 [Candidatus Sungbacteria bacterium]|uniref:Uncharacterized protein n=1 Tax=Candidatus Sungiibacteriota bacterium TaxID=2750080 RepID=A0A9D6LPZ8_9BACT|nr:hypothetical protein [Candidatus Sungbacteria bacterium]